MIFFMHDDIDPQQIKQDKHLTIIESTPKDSFELNNCIIDFNTSLSYPKFTLKWNVLTASRENYNFFLTINEAKIVVPNVPNNKNRMDLVSDFITKGKLTFTNFYKFNLVVAKSSSKDPGSDPDSYKKTWTKNVTFNYDYLIKIPQDGIEDFSKLIPYRFDTLSESLDSPENYFLSLRFPNFNFEHPVIVKNVVNLLFDSRLEYGISGSFGFQNISVPKLKFRSDSHDSESGLKFSTININNKSYFDKDDFKIKIGLNPDGPSFSGIALSPDSGGKTGFLNYSLIFSNKLFNITFNIEHNISVKHSITDGPNKMYDIEEAKNDYNGNEYEDKFLFLLKNLNIILSQPLNENTIWKYKEKI